jgi:kynurenine formamidase
MNIQPFVHEGALTRLDGDTVRKAASLVRQGRVYDLGLEINESMPQGPRGQFVPFSRAFSATPEGTGGAARPFTFSAEVVTGSLHTSTHIDAFAHVQAYGRIYGGFRAQDHRSDQGWLKYGAETIAPLVGRCLLLDVGGPDGKLSDRYEITVDDLKGALSSAGLRICTGDIVLVRTGKIRQFFEDPQAFERAAPGVGVEAAIWLYEQGMSVLGTDTAGTEPMPFANEESTTHRAMLVERGVHLLESVYLEEMAKDSVHEAFFVGLPLKFTGATGSWIRPAAII